MATKKDRALEIYTKHIALASTNGSLFRKTVMDEIMAVSGCTLAAAATDYNNAKKMSAPVAGLGRITLPRVARKTGNGKEVIKEDNDCYTVIELLKHKDSVTVGRCRSHLMQGDASEEFDDVTQYNPANAWVMIKGLGPLHSDVYKLSAGEVEIKRYTPAVDNIVEYVDLITLEQEEVAA
jgi:hypothetical protein